MSSTTALQSAPYPVGSTDAPDGPAQILALANWAEKKVVQVFATAAARTSAFSAAGVTPTEGMISWLQDLNRHEYVNSAGAWTPMPGTRLLSGSFSTDLASGAAGAEAVGYSQSAALVSGQRYKVAVILLLNIGAAGVAGVRVRFSTGTVTTSSTTAEPPSMQVPLATTGTAGRATCDFEFEITAPTTATYNIAVGLLTTSGSGQLTAVGTTTVSIVRVTAA